MNIDMTGAINASGVMVQQGSIRQSGGDTTIKTNDDGIAIWVPKVSSGSNILPGGTINGTGKMTIIGDIVNSGWGYINLTMDADLILRAQHPSITTLTLRGLDSELALRSPIKENGSLLTVHPDIAGQCGYRRTGSRQHITC
jgi:hypothetical protein